MSRFVCQFSCGAASAVATKLVLSEGHPDGSVIVVNAYIREEHADNRRFADDCQRWFGVPIIVLRNELYSCSTHEVWRRQQYMKGPRGAPCSRLLKRGLLAQVEQAGDIKVIGFTVEERNRLDLLQERFPNETYRAPLIEANMTKQDCHAIISRAGIVLPMMYRLGFSNANCIGCPKGGQAYWQAIRRLFSAEFAEIARIQEAIGEGAYFLRFRSGPRKNERMSLAELPPGDGDMKGEPDFSCSFFCDLAIRQFEGGQA
jgi:3'-phosphoadenosine 5'-phosphosulfate sulfotransferase (PAPS reductase)/FAD synthetase